MKEFEIKGKRVKVTHEPHAGGYKLTAECDGVVRESTLTFGPAEGAGPEHYDEAMLERDLDAARAKLAAEAEWHARIKTMMGNIR